MTNLRTKIQLFIATTLLLLGCQIVGNKPQELEAQASDDGISILVFSKTEGFRHSSIEPAIQFLEQKAEIRNWNVVFSEEAFLFSEAVLTQYDAVVFLMTTGDVLSENQQTAFENYIRAGGGFAGIHSASDTEYDWPFYGELVGAYFNGHPPIQTATVAKSAAVHPSTSRFPSAWDVRDEWYNFDTDPADNENISVLLWLDEDSYDGGNMGDSHPIAWAQDDFQGGRSWYTGFGHRDELYTDPEFEIFQDHIVAGIEWAAGLEDEAEPPLQLTIYSYLPTITN